MQTSLYTQLFIESFEHLLFSKTLHCCSVAFDKEVKKKTRKTKGGIHEGQASTLGIKKEKKNIEKG